MDAKTVVAVGTLVTALGGSATAIVKAVNNTSNTDALFRSYRVEIALLNAKMGVVMQKTGVVLDIDVDELKKALKDPETSWSPISSAYAQAVPVTPVIPAPGVSTVIHGCNCVCPVLVSEPPAPAIVPATPAPAQTPAQDQELFRKILKDQVRKAPKSLDQLSE